MDNHRFEGGVKVYATIDIKQQRLKYKDWV